MRRQLAALACVAFPLAVLLTTAAVLLTTVDGAAQGSPNPTMGVEVAALDRKTEPCNDFYQFACGGWIAKNPVPADRRSFGRFQQVQDRNFAILRRILE